MLKWLKASEATQIGEALADDVVLQSPLGSTVRNTGAKPAGRERDLQKFLQRFLQRVDREAARLQLNFFRRAKLANSFKWRLLEKGVEKEIVNELTQALVLRLTANQGTRVAGTKSGSSASTGAGARDTESLLTQGAGHLARGAYVEAVECYQQVVNFDPRNARARNDLGIALAQLGRYSEAEDELRRAIGTKPGFPEAHFNLAGVLQSTGRFPESEMPLRRALKLKPAYLDARVSLGMSLVLLGRLQEARECYEQALRAAPRNAQALVGTGQIEALNGNFEAAESAYRSALEVEPNLSYAWAGLVALRKMTPDGAWLKRAEEIVAVGLDPIDEATLRFAMGKYCDDVGDFSRAFRHYERANALQRMRSPPYDAAERSRFVDDLVKNYAPAALARARTDGSQSERPVFVVGMPRSGTSLVEQIIASHSSAHGAGELDFWTAALRKHESAIRAGVPGESLRRKLATEYLQVLTGKSRDALRVIDKAPVNSDYLGLINCIFPRARIIYLHRDPIDTCLSCYFQQFSPLMNYATDLSNLAHYYREHRRLMTHWRSVLPPEMLLEVPYAALIADQETWTRKILEFLGLPWDARCLDFHTTARTVNTASVWQVRQKIYTSSVGRWRNYRKFIGPLLTLGDTDP